MREKNKTFIMLIGAVTLLSACTASNTIPLNTAIERGATDKQAMSKWNDTIAKANSEDFNFFNEIATGSGKDLLDSVNTEVNNISYVPDIQNYKQTDYWATPRQFINNGGDCEDFAIAKYIVLKKKGISKNDMKIAVGQDISKGEKHAVLFVTIKNKTYILDNNKDRLVDADSNDYFKPYYTINETGFWTY